MVSAERACRSDEQGIMGAFVEMREGYVLFVLLCVCGLMSDAMKCLFLCYLFPVSLRGVTIRVYVRIRCRDTFVLHLSGCFATSALKMRH